MKSLGITILLFSLSLSFVPQNAYSASFYYKINIENLRFQGQKKESLTAVLMVVGKSTNKAFEVSRESLGPLASRRDHYFDDEFSFYISEDQIEDLAGRYAAYKADPQGYNLRLKIMKYRTVIDKHLFSVQFPLNRAEGRKYFNFLSPNQAHQIALEVISTGG